MSDIPELVIPCAVALIRSREQKPKEEDNTLLGVRLYRSTPCSSTLQLRTTRLIASAGLTAPQMRELAARLVENANELDGR